MKMYKVYLKQMQTMALFIDTDWLTLTITVTGSRSFVSPGAPPFCCGNNLCPIAPSCLQPNPQRPSQRFIFSLLWLVWQKEPGLCDLWKVHAQRRVWLRALVKSRHTSDPALSVPSSTCQDPEPPVAQQRRMTLGQMKQSPAGKKRNY